MTDDAADAAAADEEDNYDERDRCKMKGGYREETVDEHSEMGGIKRDMQFVITKTVHAIHHSILA